jgi:GTPase SAR1 family protein
MGAVLQRALSLFWTKKLEVALVGLENSGKSTLLGTLAQDASQETVPTIGMNVRSFKRGNVRMKVWDLGGQVQFRSEWGRCVAAIFFFCFVCLFRLILLFFLKYTKTRQSTPLPLTHMKCKR